jgi:hypothetical protein
MSEPNRLYWHLDFVEREFLRDARIVSTAIFRVAEVNSIC